MDAVMREAMEKHYNNNLLRYVAEHPGWYVLLEPSPNGLKETFFQHKSGLEAATKEYDGTFATIFQEKIPIKTHRFNERKRDNPFDLTGILEFRPDEHVEYCPNDPDGTTKLVRGLTGFGNEEKAYCTDCGYEVFGKASEEAIRQIEKARKERMNRRLRASVPPEINSVPLERRIV